jgi:NRAMP (natural resistance-associated macrophage protein)-like metal ion transporter
MPDRKRAIRNDSPKLGPRAFDSWWPKVLRVLSKIGPGIVTGAADDDPSGIATYSQAGAQFGYTMLWTLLFSFPLMAGIQEISAWIGRVTGIGIAGNIRRHYSVWVLYPVVALLLSANVINLGADIGAMGGALKLLVGGPALWYCVGLGSLAR